MAEVFISTDGHGNMVAEYGSMVLYLEDAWLSRAFGYGETVEIEREPYDAYDMADLLAEVA